MRFIFFSFFFSLLSSLTSSRFFAALSLSSHLSFCPASATQSTLFELSTKRESKQEAGKSALSEKNDMTKSSTTTPRPESASAPALNHRHPFLQERRQPHQHAPGAGHEASALDVTAAEKREHHHRQQHDVEGGAAAPSLPSPSVVVAPAPGDPAHPSNDGESREDDDEVRCSSVLRNREKDNGEREAAAQE